MNFEASKAVKYLQSLKHFPVRVSLYMKGYKYIDSYIPGGCSWEDVSSVEELHEMIDFIKGSQFYLDDAKKRQERFSKIVIEKIE